MGDSGSAAYEPPSTSLDDVLAGIGAAQPDYDTSYNEVSFEEQDEQDNIPDWLAAEPPPSAAPAAPMRGEENVLIG